ncbi:unnamed protein product, partial [marine sediment metagenome]
VIPVPFISASTPDSILCPGESTTILTKIDKASPSIVYYWNNIEGTTQKTVTPNTTTTYEIIVNNGNNCRDTTDITIYTVPNPELSIDKNDDVCNQGIGYANAIVVNPNDIAQWKWFKNGELFSTTPYIDSLTPGTYDIEVLDIYDCYDESSMYIPAMGEPTAEFDATPKVTNLEHANCRFFDHSTTQNENITEWQWDFGDGGAAPFDNRQNPSHIYEEAGLYEITLVVTDEQGCKDTSVQTIQVEDIFTFHAPTAFSPNGDGKNEFFCPKGTGIHQDNYQFWIFDRWGKEIFYTSDPLESWNGRLHNTGKNSMQQGVFVWRVICVDVVEQVTHEFFGHITLVK